MRTRLLEQIQEAPRGFGLAVSRVLDQELPGQAWHPGLLRKQHPELITKITEAVENQHASKSDNSSRPTELPPNSPPFAPKSISATPKTQNPPAARNRKAARNQMSDNFLQPQLKTALAQFFFRQTS
jgi:hypothetical protein